MTADDTDTSFERWALLGAAALALVGLASFLARHNSPTADDDALRDGAANSTGLVHVRIGGQRPPAPHAPAPAPARDEQAARAGAGGGADPNAREEPPDAPQTDSDPSDTPPPSHPGATREVIVQRGETLGQIVSRELGTVKRLAEVCRINGIQDPDDVRAGTKLRIPVQ